MTKLMTILGVAALSAGALTAPAHSMTIIKMLAGGPFSGTNPIGAFPVLALNSSDTYDFTFTLVPPVTGDTQTQLQAQAESGSTGTPELIRFDLYSGTPSGSHTYIATSPSAFSSFLAQYLTPGQYFVQIKPAYIAVNGEVDSGSLITASVPEPASWALMMIGACAVGAALRKRRRLALA